MNHTAQTFSLLLLLLSAGLLTGVGWGVIGGALRIAPRAAWRFAAGNLILAGGIGLVAQRTGTPSLLYYPLADLTILLGIAVLCDGVEVLLDVPRRWGRHFLLLGLAAAAVLWAPPGLEGGLLRSVIFSLLSGWFALSATRVCFARLRPEFGLALTLWLSVPFMTLVLVALLRLGRLVLYPQPQSGFAALDTPAWITLHWAYLTLLLLINMSLIAVVLGRVLIKARELVERDRDTGTLSRSALRERLAIERARRLRTGQPYCLVAADVDHLRQLNEAQGHACGDAALRHVAEVLLGELRSLDQLGRPGGDEFLIVMPMTGRGAARLVAHRLRDALAAKPLVFAGRVVPVTVSMGVAEADEAGDDDLWRRADDALFRAKRAGRNRVACDGVAREGIA